MIELAFPLSAILATLLVLMPAATWVSRSWLASKRRRLDSWADFGSESTFAWLTMPTVIPIVWLASAALHQSEPSRVLESCLVQHIETEACLDALILAVVTIVGTGAFVGHRIRTEARPVPIRRLARDHELACRASAIAANDPALAQLNIRIAFQAPASVFTRGWFRSETILDACFVGGSDDGMIRAALLHELAHVHGFDTLRFSIARCCLAMNPAGRWLLEDFECWRQAREAQCDSRAVERGADSLALAHGIVRAAKPHASGLEACKVALLCDHRLAALKLRLALLLEGPPKALKTRGQLMLCAWAVVATTLPHAAGDGLLSMFHHAVECMVASHT